MKKMKNKKFWIGMLVLILGSILAGCDIGTGSTNNNDDIEKISFTGGAYTLNIEKNGGRVVYSPATGDRYEIRNSSGNVISSGVITVDADGTYTFSPSSGKPNFSGTLSSDAASFQITSTISLDDGTQLPGLSLSNNGNNDNEVPVYTSYRAAANAGRLFHNGQIDNNLGSMEVVDAFDALMKTLDYTQIKINSNLPVSSDFRFDFSVIANELNLQANDYFKWDIQYNDHRVLARYYYIPYIHAYTLVNEVLLLPVINGKDYSSGTIKHVDYEYGVSDGSVVNDAIYNSPLTYDEFVINGKAPVDNLGLLQTTRIINAIKTARNITLRAGDYLLWKITYDDSKWAIRWFIEIVNTDGSLKLSAGNATKG
jgi:hypothetical protein